MSFWVEQNQNTVSSANWEAARDVCGVVEEGCWDGMSSGTRESCKSRCCRTSQVQGFQPINTFIRTINLVVFYH